MYNDVGDDMTYLYTDGFRIVVCGLICAWSALLTHLNISNFNDGTRSIFPELMQNRMDRKEFSKTVYSLSIGWVIAGLCQSLVLGCATAHFTLIASDIIGCKSNSKIKAFVFGGLYGVLISSFLIYMYKLIDVLPYDFSNDLLVTYKYIIGALVFFPSLACASTFGYVKGLICFICQLVSLLICKLTSLNLDYYFICALVGFVIMILFYMQIKEEAYDYDEQSKETFKANINRIKSNTILLAIQGGLHALGMCVFASGYMPYALYSCTLNDSLGTFIISMLGVFIAFSPLFVTTAINTGMLQNVSLTLSVMVGAFSHNWLIAFGLGFVVEIIELQLIEPLANYYVRHPSLEGFASNIRNAINKCTFTVLDFGCMYASYLICGIWGLGACVAIIQINDVTGKKIPAMAIAPAAVTLIGFIYNILILLNIVSL